MWKRVGWILSCSLMACTSEAELVGDGSSVGAPDSVSVDAAARALSARFLEFHQRAGREASPDGVRGEGADPDMAALDMARLETNLGALELEEREDLADSLDFLARLESRVEQGEASGEVLDAAIRSLEADLAILEAADLLARPKVSLRVSTVDASGREIDNRRIEYSRMFWIIVGEPRWAPFGKLSSPTEEPLRPGRYGVREAGLQDSRPAPVDLDADRSIDLVVAP